jgi:hypothetical protein
MEGIVSEIERTAKPGTKIPKPEPRGDFIVKRWGVRRGERALIYTIPNHKKPTKPYEKGITASEWVKAFDRLMATGEFTRSWFDRSMPSCAKEGGCNFMTIGGVFQLLGYAAHDRGVYKAATTRPPA